MTIYISGGSNSLAKDGWVSKFREVMGPNADIQNISVGAAPSHMAVYRCLSTVELSAGDTVVWEYGINDANHIYKKGMNEREFVRAVEWVIEGCAEKGAGFVAAIFQPRDLERLGGMSRYRSLLRELFDKYGVPYLDVPEAYPAAHGLRRIPPKLFRNRMHYDQDSPIMDFIAEEVTKLVRASAEAIPHTVAEKKLRFYKDFSGGSLESFKNRALETNMWKPGPDGLSGQLLGSGRLVGVVLIAKPDGGALDFEMAGASLRFSVASREKGFDKPMLKFVSFPWLFGRETRFQAGDEFSLKWADSTDGMLAYPDFRKILKQPALMGRASRIVALMTEE
ncbi:SGNH/GDSL hydrolase family protein [Antarcticimicrobium sediminis]|uniref:SGNH/GDSL hydrolase family protein n=1 Tax=Antarcticimicrobium sediminis TaxID=2546227 RepID=A0A4R5EU09_9RHOB|nr:SGNH/GDSL hydrolase family protein [Antarcticimicrobium sediminis]TDE38381.1 SGNH/GDSL hydrolase family protein [Antarcticimicrobium sediminis]